MIMPTPRTRPTPGDRLRHGLAVTLLMAGYAGILLGVGLVLLPDRVPPVAGGWVATLLIAAAGLTLWRAGVWLVRRGRGAGPPLAPVAGPAAGAAAPDDPAPSA